MRARSVATPLLLLLVMALGCAGNISPDRQIDDAILAQRVRDAIVGDAGLRDQRIEVSAAGGAVTLTGQVRSESDRARAESLARAVAGVASVQNLLSAP